ncbi:MAG: DNA gyrase subunit A [Candidatus Palauibacterales bacterium]|nr:DNA gyrase subunit A [Candidatus Palauibacterales bacterium]MDP2528904.1 DNA gyrase subunit A [Candidatus Palauibacterales bacterium]MDP2584054.1 DNA gyrase subunit A [Candidatus Palauibacterales bacterium]
MVGASTRHERIIPRFLEQEMRDSFIDYSMSVIVQRALPDARDGLKPVHRRILYAMWEQGLLPGRPYKKSATVVGDVLGKYHPHGDSAVYDTLVRMAQDFSMRYPLVDGQGNFGSIDGDSAAAYRYTEARLASISTELLEDLGQDTVDFTGNFDNRLEEPTVLPTRLPQLLLNGTDGIAVGMATKIPPHNLTELLAATAHLVRDPECTVDDLTAYIPGPDFPTGGYIWGRDGIEEAYRTGRGLVEMRARMHVEELGYGKSAIVVTELPYQVNKSRVIEQITRQVRRGRMDAITDLRDESDRDGIRLVIELKRDAEPRRLLPSLFKKTQLRYTFGIINLALVDGRPEELDLVQALRCFVDHRLEVIARRAGHDLREARDRAHVVEGLLIALDDIDRVLEIIRAAADPPAASEALQREMGLSERQAAAILAMRLASLTGLERRKLSEELAALRASIEEFELLVEDEAARRDALCLELEELSERYGDARRTEILDGHDAFPLPSGNAGGATLVLLSRRGYLKAQPVRGGAGLAGAEALAEREADFVSQAVLCQGSDSLLAVTRRGSAHALPLGDLPRGTRSSRGKPLASYLALEEGDDVVALLPVTAFDADHFLVTVTEGGQVKRTSLDEYSNVRSGGIIAAGLGHGDRVLTALVTGGGGEIVLGTGAGMAIRFEEGEVRPMGRTAQGVKGIDLEAEDRVVAALAPRRDSELFVAGSRGFGKRVPFTELRLQGRAGKGATILPDRDKAGDLVGLLEIQPGDRVVWELRSGDLVTTDASELRVRARGDACLRVLGRLEGDDVAAVHPLRSEPRSKGGEEEAGAARAEVETGATRGGGRVGGEDSGGAEGSGAGESQAELEL